MSDRVAGSARKRKVADVSVPGGVPYQSHGRDARGLDHAVVPREFAGRYPSARDQVAASEVVADLRLELVRCIAIAETDDDLVSGEDDGRDKNCPPAEWPNR